MRADHPSTVLLVDDDRVFCNAAWEALCTEGIDIHMAHTSAEARKICSSISPDVVILDQELPDGAGHELCEEIINCNDAVKIIFITAFPRFEQAVLAVQRGISDFLFKPFELEELRLALDRAIRTIGLEKSARVLCYRQARERDRNVMVGAGLEEVRRLVRLAAASDASVLVTGETGTGKNLVARAIHDAGPNAEKPFLSINCATLPENLIEAELFGYEKGAFTGAAASRGGIFEMAENGTLLLDEIAEMPLHLQSRLLNVLETKEIRRLGGSTVRPVQVRVIAATNADVGPLIGANLRQDLYFRLSVINIHVPPLRERATDVPALCDHFLRRISGRKNLVLDETETARLLSYPWPGNCRELNNLLERSVLLSEGGPLHPSAFLPREPAAPSMTREAFNAPSSAGATARDAAEGEHHREETANIPALAEVERCHIVSTLEQLSFNLARTARVLGISRSTLKRKIESFGIRVPPR